MATEKLKFKLQLYSTHWNKKPIVDVKINDKSYFKNEITGTKENPTLIEFEQECEEGKDYQLILDRSNKDPIRETIVNEKGDLLKDQLLHIKSIEIDEIDLGSLLF